MTEQANQTIIRHCDGEPDDAINILDAWQIIWKRRRMIGTIVMLAVSAMVILSLFMTNIYRAKAVIMPVIAKDNTGAGTGLATLAQQFGGMPGISMPGSASASEIVSLLKSNILREKIIQQFNLLPVLFYQQWNSEQHTWKNDGLTLNPARYLSLPRGMSASNSLPEQKKDLHAPGTWDALRLLAEIVNISQDAKQNTITISVDFHDPEMAAKIVDYFLATLTNYMSSEAKRVAATNRKYLEEQLGSTTDPFIKQKTYSMIAQQIEAGMMAEVKENFAFKVIDPPLAPDKAIKPKRAQMVIISLFAALFVGIVAAFFREYIEKMRAIK